MASCEPKRTSAYSEDLRWKMVYQSEILGLTYDSIAQNVGVDASTVWRTEKLFQETGNVEKQSYRKERAYRDLTDAAKFVLLTL